MVLFDFILFHHCIWKRSGTVYIGKSVSFDVLEDAIVYTSHTTRHNDIIKYTSWWMNYLEFRKKDIEKNKVFN